MKSIIGYHGTTFSNAESMAKGNFRPLSDRKSKWLGRGLYFFEDNLELAMHWAETAGRKYGEAPGVLRAEIDLSHCLDVTRLWGQGLVRNAYRSLCSQWEKNPEDRITQLPFSLEDGQVRAGYSGQWRGGENKLDHAVIEKAIELSKLQKNLTCDTVRGIFIEEGPLYDQSWIFEAAYVAVAVRSPEARLNDLRALPT